MVYERQRHRTTTSHSHTSTYWSNIAPERLAEGVWCTKFQFLFWTFTSVSVGSSSRSYSSTNTRSHCEKEWQKPTRSNMWLSTFKNSVACVAGGIIVPGELSWRQIRHAKRGARGKNWLVPTLVVAPSPQQYSTPMLIPPATQAKKSEVQLRSCLVPRRLSLDENVRQRKAGRRQRARLRLPSVPFPWSLAVHHQSLVFRARLYDEKNEAPEEKPVFAPFQKSRRNHLSYVRTEALSGMVSQAQKLPGTVWTLHENEIIIGYVMLQIPHNFILDNIPWNQALR